MGFKSGFGYDGGNSVVGDSRPELGGHFSRNAVPLLLLHPSPLPSLLSHSCSDVGSRSGGMIQLMIFSLLVLHGKGNPFFPAVEV